MDDDIQLMLGFQGGNIHDFEKLMQRHNRAVINLAYRFIGDAAAAEDVAQDVFLQVFRAAADYRPTAGFTTWLYQIVRNTSYSELRRRTRRPALLDERSAEPRAPSASDPLEKAETEAAVKRAIELLPENQRMALILRRYNGLPYEEIAQVMGTTESSVKALLHRSRLLLKEKLKGLSEG